ncbi:ClpP-like prohead protease/major capsid protein fusion protein [Escherichia coli]
MLNQETAKAARTDSGYILRAPRRMRVADAVAQYMRVPMGAGNSVPWDPLVAPYVIEPMNCLASREYDAVIFVGPARTGKTIGLIDGWVIYNVICDPADMLIIQMTEEKAREHSKKRLARTFRVSPEVVSRLSPNKNDNNVYDRTFLAGNYLKIGWPSVNIMSSSDYKCVALTDYDRYQTLQAQCLADPECSLEQAREKLLNEMGRESTPSNKNTPAHIYAGNGNFVGDGIRQALMARAGFEKTERDNVYNGMTLREYARMSLTERGIGVSSYNPMQMVGAAFTHSTSDFGNILLDVANKAILQGWEDAPETYEQWTRKGQLSDFKIAHRVGMGGFSALRQVREGAEYKYVTTGDKQATIALATYGELFSITRQAIINDDLNMLTDVPMKLGRAAKSTIADLVYAILTSNPKISTDNVSLFDKAKHANVLESAAMDVASLDKTRQLMRVQKEGERHLNIRPAFVLVPTAMESVANQVIRSSSVKGADINAGIINPVKDFATVIAEPRLDDNSQTTFYLAASKGSDTIEVAYLNGVDTPYIDQMEGFSVDGVTTKVRIDAGVAPVDHRGLVKCTA